jgi:hypothetical protein
LRCSDQLLDQDGFTYTGTTEQTDLTTFGIWCQKVDNFDTCLQDLYNRALFLKGRRISVDYPVLFFLQAFSTIDGVTQNIEQTTQCFSPTGTLIPAPVAVTSISR